MTPSAPLAGLAPLVAALVLVELGCGTTAVAWAIDGVARVGAGFRGTTSAICVVLTGLGLALLWAMGSGALAAGAHDADVAAAVHWTVAAVALGALDTLFAAVGTDAARRAVGAAAAVVGLVAVVAVGGLLGPALRDMAWLFVPAALLVGAALGGMLLGHWYLIAPDLSFRPLRRAVAMVFAAVALEAAALGVGLGVAPAAGRAAVVTSLPFWLLVVGSGLVFTAAVAALTYHFARIRANQPATAMLYALIVTVLLGVVTSHLISASTGVPL